MKYSNIEYMIGLNADKGIEINLIVASAAGGMIRAGLYNNENFVVHYELDDERFYMKVQGETIEEALQKLEDRAAIDSEYQHKT